MASAANLAATLAKTKGKGKDSSSGKASSVPNR